MRRVLSIALLLAALGLAPAAALSGDSLYRALGGQSGISALMEDMLIAISDDDRIVEHFLGADIMRLHELLTEQVCELSGGPCTYTGDDMVTVHTGMGITRADFNALVENLQIGFDKHGTPVSAQNRLLAKLAALHGEVVGL